MGQEKGALPGGGLGPRPVRGVTAQPELCLHGGSIAHPCTFVLGWGAGTGCAYLPDPIKLN